MAIALSQLFLEGTTIANNLFFASLRESAFKYAYRINAGSFILFVSLAVIALQPLSRQFGCFCDVFTSCLFERKNCVNFTLAKFHLLCAPICFSRKSSHDRSTSFFCGCGSQCDIHADHLHMTVNASTLHE